MSGISTVCYRYPNKRLFALQFPMAQQTMGLQKQILFRAHSPATAVGFAQGYNSSGNTHINRKPHVRLNGAVNQGASPLTAIRTMIITQYHCTRLRFLPSALLIIVRTDRTTDALYTINRMYEYNAASNRCSWSKIMLNGFLGYDR